MSVKCIISRFAVLVPLLALGFAGRIASAQADEAAAVSPKFNTLYTFSGPDGALPGSGVVQATNGDYYGTTFSGGANCNTAETCGTVFKISSSGALTKLYNFCSKPGCPDGAAPGALIQATNGELYGTASSIFSPSTVFKITPGGAFTSLYTFCSQAGCPDGVNPVAGLVQAANGDLYGTTTAGGANGHGGTIFKMTPAGTPTTLYNFCSQAECLDGSGPYAPLVQARNGDLYGTTMNGGTSSLASCSFTNGCGTIFRITTTGTLTTLYNFCSQSNCNDGSGGTWSGLVQANNGDLYGVSFGGGAYGGGTVYKITPSGVFTTVYNFCSQTNCTDGRGPFMGLIRAANGGLWGTTLYGGAVGSGTFFEITPSGILTTHNICPYTGCLQQPSGMVQGTDGNFYGTTEYGGPRGSCASGSGCGTIFSLSTGQAPFVETRPTAGKVGEAVTIIGYKLTGAASVAFNGTPAAFTVVSSTEITTSVPAGATTGKVQVVTPNGTLSSNIAFEIH